MPITIHRIRAFLLLAIGIVIAALPLILINDFMRTARPIILMGSRLEPGRTFAESALAIIILTFLFVAGAALIFIAVRNVMRSFRK